MDAELQLAINTVEHLFKTRDSPEFWSSNIIDASRHIQKKENWTKFYAYIANPTAFNANDSLKTIEDCMEECDLSYPDYMEEIRYTNGTDTTIHIKHRPRLSQDDEKTQPECEKIPV